MSVIFTGELRLEKEVTVIEVNVSLLEAKHLQHIMTECGWSALQGHERVIAIHAHDVQAMFKSLVCRVRLNQEGYFLQLYSHLRYQCPQPLERLTTVMRDGGKQSPSSCVVDLLKYCFLDAIR